MATATTAISAEGRVRSMKLLIEIPDEFISDYSNNKFTDFFERVKADMNTLCGKYEREIANMFIRAFAESRESQAVKTNADRIRSMSDEELAEWLTNMCEFMNPEDEEPYKSIYNIDTEKEEIVHDSYGSIMDWLQSEEEE